MKLINNPNVFIPEEIKSEFNTYHTFVVQVKKRTELIKYLKKNGISTAIHYPIPIHLQKAFTNKKYSKTELTKYYEAI